MMGGRRRFLDIDDSRLVYQAGLPMGRIHRIYGMNKKPNFPVGSFVRWKVTGVIFEVVRGGGDFLGISGDCRRIRCVAENYRDYEISVKTSELEVVSPLEALAGIDL